ncbi:hypothetical protein M422DRAFT_36466 [Sphaerobolus stellatus SS14]|uniref:Uncharacterized protein n=1 Tax=Sphaerobolus stellatus (strain SS14) TaxID=990650 RepID=A0A0C9U8H4_SPHS4|nr:hypothetical protein M422DRAFT_36466 [Sphaerobolus stellatus SS14]
MAAIGGGGIGKSYIFERFLTGRVTGNGQYDPTIIDTVTTYRELATGIKSQVHGVTLHLTDVSGQTEYEQLRARDCYPLQHLVMICFSVDSYRSLEFAKHQCFEEFNFYNRNNIPYVLVGCQSDKRGHHDNEEEVSVDEARWTALEIGAVAYFECSAVTGEGVDDLFQKCSEIALNWDWEDVKRGHKKLEGEPKWFKGTKKEGSCATKCLIM